MLAAVTRRAHRVCSATSRAARRTLPGERRHMGHRRRSVAGCGLSGHIGATPCRIHCLARSLVAIRHQVAVDLDDLGGVLCPSRSATTMTLSPASSNTLA